MGEPTVDLGIPFYIQAIILVVSIAMVAFFSSAEASLISVNKLRIRYLAAQGNRSAQAVNRVLDHHDKFFATILLTENAFIIFAASIGTTMTIDLLKATGAMVLLAPLVMTVLIVALAEITPKTLAAGASERWSLIVARPIGAIMALETYLIYLFTLLPRFILKLMGGKPLVWTPSVTEGELRMLIDISRAEGAVEPSEADLLDKVFRFGDRQVREVMTPRPEVIWVEQGATLEEFLAHYSEHAYTRFPVYQGSMDNIVGVLSAKDVLLALGKGELKPQDSVTTLLRPAYFVPETKTVGSTFAEMQQSGYRMILTVDEFGGIAGLVTLTQLMEVIVGQVGEEGAAPEEILAPLGENTFRVDAGVSIAEINEELNLELPAGDYQTVAGFILDRLGHIPHEEEAVEHQGLRLTVKHMDGLRIEQVELRLPRDGHQEGS
mgnify:CR=1 FL=1